MGTKITTDEYFGGCPECGKCDGFLNLGRDHWAICSEHRTRWCFGSNLLSSWRNETEEDWQRNKDKLADYQKVEPIHPEPTEEERLRMEEHHAWLAECRRVDKGYGVECGPDGLRAIEEHESIF